MRRHFAAWVLSATSACSAAPAEAPTASSPAPPLDWLDRSAAASIIETAHPNAKATHDSTHQPCAAQMALISDDKDAFCIDRFEASLARSGANREPLPWPGNRSVDGIETQIIAVSVEGQKPQGYISGKQAALACEHAGKRLCRSEEWLKACRGSAETRYPYGNERRANACNDRFKGLAHHPVVRLFRQVAEPGADPKLMWTAPWVNDPRLHELSHTVAETGSFPECINDYGVADMVGNLHEWVADRGGVFRGGFFMDTYQHGEGCDYQTSAHSMNYHDYSTGFRCCADPTSEEP